MDDPSLMPDLSHLSAEEREIIEQVFKRQKDEEAKEVQLTLKADAELDQIDKQINERKEIARKLVGTQDDAICQICQRTKFADGIGHKCFYCQLRSCARCGGRSHSKNKAIWACSLCQKRQQILAKTGKWFQPDEAQHKISNAGHESPCQNMSPIPFSSPHPSQPQQQDAAFTGTQSHSPHPESADKNKPSTRVSAPQQPMPSHKPGLVESAVSLLKQAQEPSANGPSSAKTEAPHENVRRQNTLQRQPSLVEHEQSRQHGNGSLPQKQFSTTRADVNRVEPFVQQRPNMLETQNESGNAGQGQDKRTTQSTRAREEKRHKENRPIFYTEPDSRFDEVDRSELRDEPEPQRMTSKDQRRLPTSEHGSLQTSSGYRDKPSSPLPSREDEMRRGSWRTHAKNAEIHSSHMSSGTARGKKNRLHRQTQSMSSSDEELPSTSARYDEEEVRQTPNECISEKDLLRYIYGPDKVKNSRKSGIIQLRHSADEFRPAPREPTATLVPGDLLAAKIRTYLSHPVTWQPSADQRRLIGHMVLHKTDNSRSGDLGLKVVGGRRTDTGRLGAFITRVKPGSVADTVGRLRAGDEVLEWNGQALQNATFDQVYEIISASKQDSHVEIIVSRSASIPGGDDFLNVQTQSRQLPSLQYLLSQGRQTLARRAHLTEGSARSEPSVASPGAEGNSTVSETQLFAIMGRCGIRFETLQFGQLNQALTRLCSLDSIMQALFKFNQPKYECFKIDVSHLRMYLHAMPVVSLDYYLPQLMMGVNDW
ncbi:hypothetical protein Y032_0488g2360 [Ancylostoma ceylanicum]|uniref:PDZ/DHR/GLGF domain protein n=2 Tax=Ancylostoma ceylanicum TaxID=53326 RepID=A0A016WX86_9BILA|nr:hypothetical protein Y032_0488g2360 [Ancylostoma ceylanicum]